MMKHQSFMISWNGLPFPVRFDPEVLEEFEDMYVESMDTEVRDHSDATFGPSFYLDPENRLGVVAPMIKEALTSENGIQVAKCVLWLAVRFPEITGVRIEEDDTYEFFSDASGMFDFTPYLH